MTTNSTYLNNIEYINQLEKVTKLRNELLTKYVVFVCLHSEEKFKCVWENFDKKTDEDEDVRYHIFFHQKNIKELDAEVFWEELELFDLGKTLEGYPFQKPFHMNVEKCYSDLQQPKKHWDLEELVGPLFDIQLNMRYLTGNISPLERKSILKSLAEYREYDFDFWTSF
ncbi:hypothetical protein ABG067_007643 [Albugo candida]